MERKGKGEERRKDRKGAKEREEDRKGERAYNEAIRSYGIMLFNRVSSCLNRKFCGYYFMQ